MACKELNDLMKTLKNLPNDKQKDMVAQIMSLMKSVPERSDCNSLVRSHTFKNEKPNCPHCKAQANLGLVIRKGYLKGVQRYYCKSCGHFFVATTNTAFEGTHKAPEVWEKFIQLTISGASIAKCAEECHLAIQTAFNWRHKVLNAFRVHQNTTMLSGKIELDEMLIPISYKGNHIKGSFNEQRKRTYKYDNGLPRKSFQRGSDNKSKSSKSKACVLCMVKDGNKGFYAAVPGIGFMNNAMLDKTVGKHVKKEDTMVLVDQYKVTANYLANNNYNHMILAANTSENYNDHKPEIRDDNHLQHVNAMHMHLRRFLRKYCGVSTKYLENYISLYVWLKNITAHKQKKHTQKMSVSRMSTSDCYITRKKLESFPAVPMCV